MTGIILDTNLLLIPFTQKVDIFAELERVCNFPYELYIVDKTIEELDNIITGQKGLEKKAAKIAKDMLEMKQIEVISTEGGHADDLILSLAHEKGYYVATIDKDLRLRLRKIGVPVIFLRQKKYLEVEK